VTSLYITVVYSNVREIQRINDKELDLALSGASWHDEYKGVFITFTLICLALTHRMLDSAYIFVGGLNTELTEGDVVTIFSQCVRANVAVILIHLTLLRYGEVMDVNMPRDKDTGKPKGFAFMMYEDQRSTVLAVDNLNGAKVLERTLRVDHVKNYKQKKIKNDDGEWMDPEEQSMNAKPEMIAGMSPDIFLSAPG
jgi:RNA-binding motif protein, X-linked 2